MNKTLEDHRGRMSSMRVAFVAIIAIVAVLCVAWVVVFIQEAGKEATDYSGLALILGGIFGIGGAGVFGKVVQKKFETSEYIEQYTEEEAIQILNDVREAAKQKNDYKEPAEVKGFKK
jgi:hypothetical protein